MADAYDLEITALQAMAASTDGWIALPELAAHLETRLGSSDATAKDARSAQSRNFQDDIRQLISAAPGSGSIVDRGLAQIDETGGRLHITDAGRKFIGR